MRNWTDLENYQFDEDHLLYETDQVMFPVQSDNFVMYTSPRIAEAIKDVIFTRIAADSTMWNRVLS